jgi:ACS family allantoate permease-like MFS transporter
MGIVKDAHLTGEKFNWLGSAFYIGYLVAEYPANLTLQLLPIAKFLSSQIILWGGIAMVMVCHLTSMQKTRNVHKSTNHLWF